MAKIETTSQAITLLRGSKTASKSLMSVAASALTQKSGKRRDEKNITSAIKILRDPKASKAAKTIAASLLTQWPANAPKKNAKKLSKAVRLIVERRSKTLK